MTSFSRMRISVDVNGLASTMESVLNVGLYFEKNGLLKPMSNQNLFVVFDILQNTSYRYKGSEKQMFIHLKGKI